MLYYNHLFQIKPDTASSIIGFLSVKAHHILQEEGHESESNRPDGKSGSESKVAAGTEPVQQRVYVGGIAGCARLVSMYFELCWKVPIWRYTPCAPAAVFPICCPRTRNWMCWQRTPMDRCTTLKFNALPPWIMPAGCAIMGHRLTVVSWKKVPDTRICPMYILFISVKRICGSWA